MAEVVKSYKTLEYFSLPGYFRLPRDLTTRAKVGIVQIVKTLWNTQDYTPELALKLFKPDKPLLAYRSQIGVQITIVLLHYKLPYGGAQTPDGVVCGDKHSPVYVHCKVSSIGHRFRLTRVR